MKSDSLKKFYDENALKWLKIKKSRSIDRVGKLLIQTLPIKREAALDLGCGTGVYGEFLGGRFKKVWGIDISLEMLKLGEGYRRSMDFIQADALLLPFKNSSVDIIISSGLSEHLKKVEGLFSEVFRILKPEGLFSLSVLNKSSIWNRYGSWNYPSGLYYHSFHEINRAAQENGLKNKKLNYLLWAGPFSSHLPSCLDRLDFYLPSFFCHRFVALYSK
ncbi:MAG: class I SAM-dependent methyltransferase [Candidatus Aminicenantes bacterium]|nr:class I SAM-dependent methyltransferase [Candidatus Aminicenantes bacterium]